MDYYDDDFGYDVMAHMAEDPVDFYTNGYGGFGYDTSHVEPNEKHSNLYLAAIAGNLREVKRLVEGTDDDNQKVTLLTKARRWTEVDFKASGFTKEYEWFDATPLIIAAKEGHMDVVQFLLEQGADPTLRGCLDEDEFLTPMKAAQAGCGQNIADGLIPKVITSSHLPSPGSKQTLKERAKEILLRPQRIRHIVTLLEVALKHWETSSYASPNYDSKKRSTFTNKPKSQSDLLQALKEVTFVAKLLKREKLEWIEKELGRVRKEQEKERNMKNTSQRGAKRSRDMA